MSETHWELKLYRGKAGLERIADDWRKLNEAMPAPRDHQLFDWHQCFLEELEEEPEAVHFCLLRADGELEAIFPLKRVTERRCGLKARVLTLPKLGTSLRDIICRETYPPAECVARMLHFAHGYPELRWDELQLRSVMEDAQATAALRNGAHPLVVSESAGWVDCLIPKPTEERWAQYSKGARKTLRRAKHFLDQLDNASFVTVNTWPELERAYEDFMEMEAAGWKGVAEGGLAIKLSERWTAFYRALLKRFAATGQSEITLLRHGERAIGGTIGFIVGDTIYLSKIAYDEEYARVAPGNMIHEHLLDRFAADDRINCINLVTGAEWHRKWNPECIPLHHHTLFNFTPVGLVAYCAQRLKQKMRPLYQERIKPLLKRKKAAG